MNRTPDEIGFAAKPEVAEITSLSIPTIDRLVAAGAFPRPVRLSRQRVAFVRSEVQRWIAARLAERDIAAAV